jgi:hypothetical protein
MNRLETSTLLADFFCLSLFLFLWRRSRFVGTVVIAYSWTSAWGHFFDFVKDHPRVFLVLNVLHLASLVPLKRVATVFGAVYELVRLAFVSVWRCVAALVFAVSQRELVEGESPLLLLVLLLPPLMCHHLATG